MPDTLTPNDVFVLNFVGQIPNESKVVAGTPTDKGERIYCKNLKTLIIRNTDSTNLSSTFTFKSLKMPSNFLAPADRVAYGYFSDYTALAVKKYEFSGANSLPAVTGTSPVDEANIAVALKYAGLDKEN